MGDYQKDLIKTEFKAALRMYFSIVSAVARLSPKGVSKAFADFDKARADFDDRHRLDQTRSKAPSR